MITSLARFGPTPQNGTAYVARGLIWADKGEYDKANSDYSKAIRIDPMHEVAYYNRGNAWLSKGDLDKAITDYSKAIPNRSLLLLGVRQPGPRLALNKGEFTRSHLPTTTRRSECVPKVVDRRTTTSPGCGPPARTPKYRDGKRAVESATRRLQVIAVARRPQPHRYPRCRQRGGRRLRHGDQTPGKGASERYKEEKLRALAHELLSVYRAKKPYHEEPDAK